MKLRKLQGKIKLIKEDYLKGVPLCEISAKYGCARQTIWKHIKKTSLKKRRILEYKTIICNNLECRKEFKVANFRASKYCCHACYVKAREISSIGQNNGNLTDRAYRLRARQLTNCIKGQVIHHIDGNVSNNNISNLMVFNSQSEHLAYHHSLRTS